MILFKTTVPLTMDYFVAEILKTVTSWSPSPAAHFIVFEDGKILQIFLVEYLFLKFCTGQCPDQIFITILDHSIIFDFLLVIIVV